MISPWNFVERYWTVLTGFVRLWRCEWSLSYFIEANANFHLAVMYRNSLLCLPTATSQMQSTYSWHKRWCIKREKPCNPVDGLSTLYLHVCPLYDPSRQLTDHVDCSVMWVPAWFPGASFQTWARKARSLFLKMTRTPFHASKMESVSYISGVLLQLLTVPGVGKPTARMLRPEKPQ